MESDAPVTGLQYAENPDFVSYEPECQQPRSQPLSSNQIEMDSLPSPSPVGRQSQDKALGSGETQYDMTSTSCLPQHALKREKSNDTSLHVASEPTKLGGEQLLFTSEDTPLPTDDLAAPITREKTMPAIGPATDKPTPIAKETTSEGPVLYITLLLASTGARHPYKLDGKYMQKRNVEVDGNNPIHMSLYKLKELILRDWRDGKQYLALHINEYEPLTYQKRMGFQAVKSRIHSSDLHGKNA